MTQIYQRICVRSSEKTTIEGLSVLNKTVVDDGYINDVDVQKLHYSVTEKLSFLLVSVTREVHEIGREKE